MIRPDAHMVLALLDYRKHLIADHDAMGLMSGQFDVKYQFGSKYIRVFTVSHGSRSCHSFIEADGTIWKSASWKAPAKNFPRGRVTDPTSWVNIHWNGITSAV